MLNVRFDVNKGEFTESGVHDKKIIIIQCESGIIFIGRLVQSLYQQMMLLLKQDSERWVNQ